MTDPTAILLTEEQVSALTNINVHTLRRWRSTKSQDLPYVKIGSRVFYRRRDVEAWIDRHLVGAVALGA